MRLWFVKWWRQRREPQGVDLLTKSTGIAPYLSRGRPGPRRDRWLPPIMTHKPLLSLPLRAL